MIQLTQEKTELLVKTYKTIKQQGNLSVWGLARLIGRMTAAIFQVPLRYQNLQRDPKSMGTRFGDGITCFPTKVGDFGLPWRGCLTAAVCSKSSLPEQEVRQAVSYINHMVGTCSPQVASQLWSWRLERGMTLSTEHLPDVDNCMADPVICRMAASRGHLPEPDERGLPVQCGSFCHTPELLSLPADPFALGTDAIPWTGGRGTLFHYLSWSAKRLKSTTLLVAPVWELTTVVTRNNLLTDPFGQHHSLVLTGQLQLATWTLSGDNTELKAFQEKLHSCSPLNGVEGLTLHTKAI